MKLNPWYLGAAAPIAMFAAEGEYAAQLTIIGLTFGIFFGTLSLKRAQSSDATTTNPGH